jgi:hypothetical protein
MLMKCRNCKKKYESDEWKTSLSINGLCSDECRKEYQKHIKNSFIEKKFFKEMKRIEKEEEQ